MFPVKRIPSSSAHTSPPASGKEAVRSDWLSTSCPMKMRRPAGASPRTGPSGVGGDTCSNNDWRVRREEPGSWKDEGPEGAISSSTYSACSRGSPGAGGRSATSSRATADRSR